MGADNGKNSNRKQFPSLAALWRNRTVVHPLHRWVRRLFTPAPRPPQPRPAFRPTLERLEDRLTPSVTFAGQQTFAVSNEPQAVAVADFNGDGKPDFVTAENNPNTGAGNISVFFNTTAPGATAPSFAAPVTFACNPNPAAIAVGDFNDDGKPDLVVVNGTPTVSVLLNTTPTGATAPTFTTPLTFAVGSSPNSVAVGDFNGDGLPDIAVANGNANDVSILMNTTAIGSTTPSFATQALFAAGEAPYSVTVGDINDDGKPDIVVASAGDNTVSVLLDTTAAGATAPTFAPRDSFAVGNEPLSVTLGDFNGDGRPDLAVANFNFHGPATVSILLETAAGSTTAAFASQVTFAVGNSPSAIAVEDFNGDGRPDLVTATQGTDSVSVLLDTTAAGATAPTFAPQVTFNVGTLPVSVAVADFNGDGRPDLAVANEDDTVSVLLNTTAPQTVLPSFGGKQTFAAGSLASSVAAADFNGDGRPDLAVSDSGAGRVAVLLNPTAPGVTTPSFSAQITFAAGGDPLSARAADFNGDGRPDLVVVNLGGTVSVFLNTTPAGATVPSFAPQTTFAVGHSSTAVVVGDFNGDGRPDLAVANFDDGTVSVLLNTTPAGASAPSFAAQTTFAVGTNPDALTVGDFNGDGKPDLAVANDAAAGTVSVLLNKTAAGASVPSFAVQKTFAVGANPDSVAAGDFNGDGKLDLAVASDATAGTVSVLLNKTAAGASVPSFASQITFAAGADPLSVTAGDFNGDGTTDLAVVNPFDGTVSVLSDATAGGPSGLFFLARRTFAAGSSPVWVTAADFNGDGRPDLAVADNISAGTVSVLPNTTTPFAATTPAVVADVHGMGVVEYNRTTGAWVQLNPGNPADVTLLAADAQGDVFADYRGYGVFRYTPSLGFWQMVNGTDAVAIATDARGDLFASFTGAGVGLFRLDGSSQLLTPVAAALLSSNANGDLVGDFTGYGVQRRTAFSGAWVGVNGVDAEAVAIDGAGDVFASFNGAGVGVFRPDGSASLLTPVAATLLAVNGNGVLAGEFVGYGVSRYTPATGAWVKVNGTDAEALAVDAAGDVFASFNGAGVGLFPLGGGGRLLSPSAASLLAADPFGDPFAPL